MTKEFKEYLQNTKNEFVTAVHELNLSPAQRVPMENILIAFDQCRHKLEEAQLQQHGVGGPASASVSEGEQLGNEAWDTVAARGNCPYANHDLHLKLFGYCNACETRIERSSHEGQP